MRWLLVLALLGVAGCGRDGGTGPDGDDGGGGGNGGEGTPLEVISTIPARGATDALTGAIVTASFNQSLDPATLTPSTFLLRLDGTQLATQVGYDAPNRVGHLVGPILPGTAYEAEVTAEVKGMNGEALSNAYRWSFTTRPVAAVSVDPAGGRHTSLALDVTGGAHVTHQDNSTGELKYATCSSDCANAANWQTAVVDSDGDFTSLEVDGTGRLHVSYFGSLNEPRYATCAAACTSSTSWQTVAVDASGTRGEYSSLAVDGSGGVHMSYWDEAHRYLKYATCSASCAIAANWRSAVLDGAGQYGEFNSLAVDGLGRLHLVYHEETSGVLLYAFCFTDCLGNGWQTVVVDPTDDAGAGTSIAVDAAGRVHIAYHADDTDELRYATCGSGCTSSAAWQALTLDSNGDSGEFTSIAVDQNGRVHVSYWQYPADDLRYATCAASCTNGGWQYAVLDAPGRVGRYNSLAVSPNGRLHITYLDEDNDALKYIE